MWSHALVSVGLGPNSQSGTNRPVKTNITLTAVCTPCRFHTFAGNTELAQAVFILVLWLAQSIGPVRCLDAKKKRLRFKGMVIPVCFLAPAPGTEAATFCKKPCTKKGFFLQILCLRVLLSLPAVVAQFKPIRFNSLGPGSNIP